MSTNSLPFLHGVPAPADLPFGAEGATPLRGDHLESAEEILGIRRGALPFCPKFSSCTRSPWDEPEW